MSHFVTDSLQQVFAFAKSNAKGLSAKEAKSRQLLQGQNVIKQQNKNSMFKLFVSQFKDFMVLLLVAAAFVSGVIAYLSKDSHQLFDTVIIVFIIFLNATVGFVQQYRADKAIEQLKKMSNCKVKTKRDGVVCLVDSQNIVVGDVVLLSEGDYIPADCRLIRADNLHCDESSLTGESHVVEKTTNFTATKKMTVGDVKNMVFSSCYVVRGECEAVVVAIGMDTQIGKIADMLDNEEENQTPLQKSLNTLGKFISYGVISIAIVIFAFGAFFKNTPLVQNFMSSVAIAVAAIPEGLPAVVTIIMAMGMQKMSKSKAIVRKLHAVETLGSCNYICSDKTGTLTQNKMQVVDMWGDVKNIHFANCMFFCSSVKGDYGNYIGDPTEVALKNYLHQNKIVCDNGFVTKTLPFDSNRKLMSVCVNGKVCYTKGAPDILMHKCAYIAKEGKIVPFAQQNKEQVSKQNIKMASNALRVLGFAYKLGNALEENNLVFVGLCGMIDPPRQEAYDAVKKCKQAGITPVMITGDHKNTAFAIAKQLDIANDVSQVVDGCQLDNMSQKQLCDSVKNIRVYARVSPKHKSMVVQALQSQGNVVAMTGDGINDAPSIKRADVGIAMGNTGTDVTKNASDMIVADDNFATIVTAVGEGRRIFANIKKTIQFFLATNVAEVFCIFVVSVLFARYDFLLSSQLLWINLVTDSFPVLALGGEKAEKDIMSRKPQLATKSMFDKQSVSSIMFFGIAISVLCLTAFFVSLSLYGNKVATTVTFFTMSFAELFHALNVKSAKASLFDGFFSNKPLLVTIVVGVVVNVAICFVEPFANALGVVMLDASQWLLVFCLSLSILVVGEVYKIFCKNKDKLQ